MFATLFMKGAVIFTMGSSDINVEHCRVLKNVMEQDIINTFVAYPELMVTPDGQKLFKSDFKVVCIKDQLPIGYISE